MEIQKRIYGLPQARNIANSKLKLHLAKFGYESALINPGLWWHQTRPLQFSLELNDFGVKYECQEYITHLLDALKIFYMISEEWYGKLYGGLNLKWD